MVKVSDFLKKHGMNYKVAKYPSAFKKPDGTYVDVEDQYHLVRSTDEVAIDPATVSDIYAPMNPQQLMAPLEPLMSEGWITPDRGFLFKEGSFEVIRFRIDGGQLEDDGNVCGEKWFHYFSLHNHQGGGGKVRGLIHSTRDICTNQVMRLSKLNGFAIRHTGEIQQQYEWAIQTWKKLKEEIRELSKRMEVFAETKVSAKDAVEIFQDIYAVKGKTAEEISTKTANKLEFAIKEFSNPLRGTYGKSFADVYNAITATNSHYATKNSKEEENKKLASLYDEAGSRNKLEARTMLVLSGLLS